MSKYREIKTEYRNLKSLKKALSDMGVPFEVAQDYRNPDLSMFGYHADLRPEKASLVIRRQWLNGHWSCRYYGAGFHPGVSNDIGFAWDGKQFTAIVSDYDSRNLGVKEAMNNLNQRYSFHETMRLAHANGYLVKSSTSENGKIRVVIQKVG